MKAVLRGNEVMLSYGCIIFSRGLYFTSGDPCCTLVLSLSLFLSFEGFELIVSDENHLKRPTIHLRECIGVMRKSADWIEGKGFAGPQVKIEKHSKELCTRFERSKMVPSFG